MAIFTITILLVGALFSFGAYFRKQRTSFLILFIGFCFFIAQYLLYSIYGQIIANFDEPSAAQAHNTNLMIFMALNLIGCLFLTAGAIMLSREVPPQGQAARTRTRPETEPKPKAGPKMESEAGKPASAPPPRAQPEPGAETDKTDDEQPDKPFFNPMDPFPIPRAPRRGERDARERQPPPGTDDLDAPIA